MPDKQLEFSFGGPEKPKKKSPKKKKPEVLAPTSEGEATYVDFSKTRNPQKPLPPKRSTPRRGDVARITKKGELKLKDVGKRRGYRAVGMGYVLFLALGVVAVFLGMLVYLKGYQQVTRMGKKAEEAGSVLLQSPEEEVTVRIEGGMSASQVARLLQEHGVVEDAEALLAYLQDQGLATKIQKGTYRFAGPSSSVQIARTITRAPRSIQSVIPAGWTLSQVDGYLVQRGYAKEGEFLQATRALEATEGLSFAEGWFLAGTYEETDPGKLARDMHQQAIDAIYRFIEEPPVHRWGVEAVLKVASLIQAETQNVEEMPLISGIIYRRLEEGMPLGIDATTRYELNDWTHPISQETYEKDTPYNTRRRPGLPPSGISCPSLEAIQAACIPIQTESRYYLHGKDGRIHTAVDYEEHRNNIKRYL